ncbi:hypothetical protein ACFQY5_29770 [Paeniroseomonas aquatica]|uniref:hypothetical protein n=1 Tax=Paeniroseomonas aquatica TaxID=373043 RepID=UPI0036194BB0
MDDDALAAATRRRQARERIMSHGWLILGVLIFAFPVWITLVGSTHDASTIGRGDVPLLPGPHAIENYTAAWTSGGEGATAPAPPRSCCGTAR